MKRMLHGLALVAATLGVVGCGDDTTEPATTPPADVDAYVETLPDWSTYSPLVADTDAPTGDTTYDAGGLQGDVRFVCASTPRDLTKTPEEILTYTTSPGALYLGSLIQGDTYAHGAGGMEELPIRQRAPLTITIDNLAFSENTRTVDHPDASTVNAAIQEMVAIAESEGLQPSSQVRWSSVEAHDQAQVLLKLGLSARYMSGDARVDFSFQREWDEHTYAAKFVHKMFTTSMVHPQTPSDLFGDDFTQEHLQQQIDLGRIGPDNPPVYVSEVVWGRLLVMTITSTRERTEIETALQACYQNITSGVEIEAEAAALLASSRTRISYVALGGNVTGVENLIRTGRIGDYFAEDAELTSAVPLAYRLHDLADGSPARVSETFVYDERECGPSVAIHSDFLTWEQAVNDLGGRTRVFETTADNVCTCDEVASVTSNQELGGTLTWASVPDIPAVGFRFDALQGHITWRDNEGPGGPRDLSVGDADNWEDDDFEMTLLTTACDDQIVGLGLTVHDNTVTGQEYLAVYDLDGLQMASFRGEDLPEGNNAFMGIVSPLPFRLLHFEEDDGGDDLFVHDFTFGVRNCPD